MKAKLLRLRMIKIDSIRSYLVRLVRRIHVPDRPVVPHLMVLAAVTGILAMIVVPSSPFLGPIVANTYLAFAILMALTILAFQHQGLAGRSAAGLNRLSIWMAARGAFTSDAAREAPKFAILRMLFGCFLLDRVLAIILRMPASDWSDPLIALPILTILALSCMLIAGFLTQAVLILLILLDWQFFERILRTATLGNDIAAMLGVLLLMSNAGAHFSVDGWLRRRDHMLGRIVRSGYFTDGLAPNNALQIAKFITLGSYWLVCVYSLMMHLNEEAWMTGMAGPHLLSNQFMTRFGDAFVWLFQTGGDPAITAARISLWIMLPWYALVLPGVLIGGWIRRFIIVWGLLFFTLCLVVLQLGWLAEFEFLFWAGLFIGPALLGRQNDLNVAYDDRCNLCDRTVNFIRRIDLFGRIELRPVSGSNDWLAERNIDIKDALTDLYGFDVSTGKMAHGYRFYELLTRKLVLLWPFHPILVLGRWIRIGPALYRFIADRRTRLFGVCHMPTPKPDVRIRSGSAAVGQIASTSLVLPLTAHWAVLCIVFLMNTPAPFIGYSGVPIPEFAEKPVRKMVHAAHVYGMTPIDVFNRTDLRMTENWFTLSRSDSQGNEQLLPIFNRKGQRLGLHRSDRVYFGHTVAFRRWSIGREGCHFETWRSKMEYLAKHAPAADGQSDELIYTQYLQPQVRDADLYEGNYILQPTEVICRIAFTPAG